MYTLPADLIYFGFNEKYSFFFAKEKKIDIHSFKRIIIKREGGREGGSFLFFSLFLDFQKRL